MAAREKPQPRARQCLGEALSGNGGHAAAAPTFRVEVVHVPSPDARRRLALAIDYLLSRIAEDSTHDS